MKRFLNHQRVILLDTK